MFVLQSESESESESDYVMKVTGMSLSLSRVFLWFFWVVLSLQ